MTKQIFQHAIKRIAIIFFMAASIGCNSNYKSEANDSSMVITEGESVPDSVVQFLITSAATDFRNHQPPTAMDFRNIKIGYIKSPNSEMTFVLCGEFLAQENREWTEFSTIKTSGYEQYLGKTQYCQDAIIVLANEGLSSALKNKFAE